MIERANKVIGKFGLQNQKIESKQEIIEISLED